MENITPIIETWENPLVNIAAIEPSKIANITSDFNSEEVMDKIVESFDENASVKAFHICWDKLSAQELLVALGNLGLNADIDYSKLTKPQKFELLDCYFEFKSNTLFLYGLTCTWCKLLLTLKGLDTSTTGILDSEEVVEYSSTRKLKLEEHILFLDSLLLYLQLKGPLKDCTSLEGIITDENQNLPKTIISLFYLPEFFDYYSVAVSNLVNYSTYFDDSNYCFGGKNLYHHFINNPYNTLSQFVQLASNTVINQEELNALFKELKYMEDVK